MASSTKDGDLKKVRALTLHLSDYATQVSRDLLCSEAELWRIGLAASGSMRYPDQWDSDEIFPDGDFVDGGTTRYALWRAALLRMLDLMGPLEVRYRTGYEDQELRPAITRFFDKLTRR